MKFICGRNFGRNSRRRDSATDFELYKIFYTGNATIIAKKFFGGIIVDDKAIAAQKLAEAKKITIWGNTSTPSPIANRH